MRNHLVILVGIPGCGKSTWADDILCDHTVVSSDAIRAQLGDVNDQTKNDEVFFIFYERIMAALKRGENVVADSTALTKDSRNRLRAISKSAGTSTHLIYFSNCTQAMQRNLRRDRRVPDDVMLKMLDKYERFKIDLIQEIGCYNSITEIRSS